MSNKQDLMVTCNTCKQKVDRSLGIKEHLNWHLYIEYLVTVFTCSYCEFSTHRYSGITEHVRSVHKNKKEAFEDMRDKQDNPELLKLLLQQCFGESQKSMTKKKNVSDEEINETGIKNDQTADKTTELLHLKKETKIGNKRDKKTKKAAQPIKKSDNTIVCIKCNMKMYENLRSRHLYKHMKDDYSINMFHCSLCKTETHRRDYMSRHTRKHHKGQNMAFEEKSADVSILALLDSTSKECFGETYKSKETKSSSRENFKKVESDDATANSAI